MVNLSSLNTQSSNYDFREVALDTWKVLVPFYHEDGDMYEVFIQQSPEDEGKVRLTDFGLTLMRLSYTFDIDTPNKRSTLSSIVSQNKCKLEDGQIYVDITANRFYAAVNTFAQVISKVMNMDIIGKEILKSHFYEFLQEFMASQLSGYDIKQDVQPLSAETDLTVDFEIAAPKPIYLFGVKDDAKASRAIITCMMFREKRLPFRSLVVHESVESLTKFNQRRVMNVMDKQFYTLDDFRSDGREYLDRETA